MSSLPRCLPKSSDIATIDSNGAATAVNYRGPAKVVYGHIVNPRPEWVNNTINIDTGCGFGGRLTALRYPELELISVPAQRAYVEGRVHFLQERAVSSQQEIEDVLDLADFTGKRIIETGLMGNVTIREENSAAAFGGDEPVCIGATVARLPTAHDVALRHGHG